MPHAQTQHNQGSNHAIAAMADEQDLMAFPEMTISNLPDTLIPGPLIRALQAREYDALTPVQAAVLEPDALGRDLIVSARTGSGKTVAFGLSIGVDLLGDDAQLPAADTPLALIVAPTRELALQVSRELAWLYADTGIQMATCVGGMDPLKERRNLRRGAQLVVGTPGRLKDHLERRALDLSAVSHIILDEADEMLDMGFREDLEAILDATPETRRTLLFSATMPKPIVALARRYQRDARQISTMSEQRGHGDITYQAATVAPADIEGAVINLLRYHEADTAIVFCATRDKVRQMHALLLDRGFAAVALSGEHSQNERNFALQALRDQRARICVATDVAARGIDVPSLSLVIHADVPRDAEILQHRSGRTGRAGRKGTAVLIVPFSRRRRTEAMLRHAKVMAEWINVPDPEAIRQKDQERLFAKLMQPDEGGEPSADEQALVSRLLEHKSAQDVALALVRAHQGQLPFIEELSNTTAMSQDKTGKAHHRPGFEDVVWFRINVGRRQNADPRWILPLLCRHGQISRNEIGAIRIAPNETCFQIPRKLAHSFQAATEHNLSAAKGKEAEIMIEPAPDGPDYPPRKRHRVSTGKPAHRKGPTHKKGSTHRKGPAHGKGPTQGKGFEHRKDFARKKDKAHLRAEVKKSRPAGQPPQQAAPKKH